MKEFVKRPKRAPFCRQASAGVFSIVFPYSIIYALHEDYILVLAIMHFRRKPGYWKGRLESDH